MSSVVTSTWGAFGLLAGFYLGLLVAVTLQYLGSPHQRLLVRSLSRPAAHGWGLVALVTGLLCGAFVYSMLTLVLAFCAVTMLWAGCLPLLGLLGPEPSTSGSKRESDA